MMHYIMLLVHIKKIVVINWNQLLNHWNNIQIKEHTIMMVICFANNIVLLSKNLLFYYRLTSNQLDSWKSIGIGDSLSLRRLNLCLCLIFWEVWWMRFVYLLNSRLNEGGEMEMANILYICEVIARIMG